MDKVKLTKSVLNKFIIWSSSRYNSYFGYGNKKENVELVYKALIEGNYKGENIFTIQCAQSVGESGSGKYWKTKGGGDDYIINCSEKTITSKYSKREIQFL